MATINNTKNRDAILGRIRAGKPANEPHPVVPHYLWPGDKLANFIEHLEDFDGKAQKFATRADALAWLEKNIDKQGKVVCSALPDYKGTVTPDDYPDPHKCTDIDVHVSEALLGIGEMGSLYLTDKALGKPACALLSIDMFVLIDADKIVDGMHTAYDQLAPIIRDHPYGSLFSGPSATADIEAVHVTGAQGEISLTALIYNCPA